MKYRVFDDEFKKMAVALSKLKVSVKDAATELDIDRVVWQNWRKINVNLLYCIIIYLNPTFAKPKNFSGNPTTTQIKP